MKIETATKKLLLKVTKRKNGCWEWSGRISNYGYGIMYFSGEKSAHRVSYSIFIGKIPKGKQIDHLCRNRICVNPNHLEAVTPRENVLRGEGLCAQNARKQKCPRGHVYDRSGYEKTIHRSCSECTRVRQRESYRKKKNVPKDRFRV